MKNFTYKDLACQCGQLGCLRMPKMIPAIEKFLKFVDDLRDHAGVTLTVNSYFRCPLHAETKKNPTSAHALGLAIDLSPRGIHVARLYLASEGPFFSGIGISDIGKPEDQFVHVDCKPGRVARWKYKIGGGEEYLFVV